MKSYVQEDPKKAQALQKMAAITLERLSTTDTEKYPSNTLIDYYDIIHKLLEAQLLLRGVKIKGEGAHYELIEESCKHNIIDESTRHFLQQMRDYRNRISYEGFSIAKQYIRRNKKRIEQIIGTL
ncbi:MAG: hypothetical protein ACQESE_00660 [Nanobdellota archaeon]